MKISNISISVGDVELLEILKGYLNSKNINFKSVEICESIIIKNIKYKIFRNITLKLNIIKVVSNKIYLEMNKISLKGMTIPKYIVELIMKFTSVKVLKEVRNDNKIVFIIDINEYIENSNIKFNINKLSINHGCIDANFSNIFINKVTNNLKPSNKGGFFLKLTQTTLRLSGEDIMSFIKDFVKSNNFSIFGVDISQAIYVKGLIISSFEVGDVSVNIKDLKENLLYVQIKIINPIFPGINIEHIPIKIYVKDLIRSFTNLNMDLDINGIRFIDDCIEVKINNFNFDMKSLSSGSSNIFLK